MLRAHFFLCIIGLLSTHVLCAGVPEPARLPESRYAAMKARSPFALATAAAPLAASPGSFASNWYVGGIGRFGDADFVTIKSRDLSAQFTLFGHETHPEHHVSVASVNWSDAIGQSTVILQRGTETAKLEFDQSLLRAQPTTTAQPQAAPASPNALRAGGEPPRPATLSANGGSPLVVPNRTERQFSPSTSRSPGVVQRRVQIIAQPR